MTNPLRNIVKSNNCPAHDFNSTKKICFTVNIYKGECFLIFIMMPSIPKARLEMMDVKANVIIVITLLGDLS